MTISFPRALQGELRLKPRRFPGVTQIPPGLPGQIAVWDDPTNDFDPSDAVLLFSQDVVGSNENTDMFVHYPLPDIAVSGVFFIGASLNVPINQGFPAPLDLHAQVTVGQAWSAGDSVHLDMNNLGGGSLPLFDHADDGWLLRAQGDNRIGSSYCTSSANSISVSGSRISARGSTSLADMDVSLEADNAPPSQFGIFYFGPDQVQLPFGNGSRCVGGMTVRLPPQTATNGAFSYSVDFATYGADLASMGTANFQCWYRDPAAGGSAFNLSDGLEIVFVP